MFHIKICGVRREADVEAVAEAGGDAIGLNFFPPSRRYVDPQTAETRALAEVARRRRLQVIGVVVNRSIDSIVDLSQRLPLDAIQLHGDETTEFVDRLRQGCSLPIVRAVKLPAGVLDSAAIDAAARPWEEIGCHLLLDVDAGAAYGGSGKTLNWDAVGTWARQHPDRPWTLAGGLSPENVGVAIRRSGARSVDAASGVELPKGTKSPERIAAFISAVDH